MVPFLGTEARRAGVVNRYQLATRYDPVFRDVYMPRGHELTAVDKALAAWLWSGRQATVAGLSAAALHGSLWIDARLPAELNQRSQHKTEGILLQSGRIADEEKCTIDGVTLTTPARTAFDLGRRVDLMTAVIRVDALMRATQLTPADVYPLLEVHRGARGAVLLRRVLAVADPGAESPQESRTRLLLVSSGFPQPSTQVAVFDGRYLVARLDMGWEEWRVGVEFDGAQHWTDPRQRSRDIDRLAELAALGWTIVRVSGEMLRNRPRTVVERIRAALRANGCPRV
ncbi:MAG: endonuclease domain-containing protein [Mycobacterium sp.]